MTLLDLKLEVDRLCVSQPTNLDTNISEIAVVDNGDWRFIEARFKESHQIDRILAEVQRLQHMVASGLPSRKPDPFFGDADNLRITSKAS